MRDVHKSISIPSTASKTHHQGVAGAFPRVSVPHQRPDTRRARTPVYARAWFAEQTAARKAGDFFKRPQDA